MSGKRHQEELLPSFLPTSLPVSTASAYASTWQERLYESRSSRWQSQDERRAAKAGTISIACSSIRTCGSEGRCRQGFTETGRPMQATRVRDDRSRTAHHTKHLSLRAGAVWLKQGQSSEAKLACYSRARRRSQLLPPGSCRIQVPGVSHRLPWLLGACREAPKLFPT